MMLMEDLSSICVLQPSEIGSLVFGRLAKGTSSSFWIAVVCNYSWGGSVAVSLRCWQRMPFAFEVLHLASGKRVHNLAKKENFLFGSLPQAGFQTKWAPLMLKCTHYTYKIVCQKKKGSRNIPPHFMKVQLDHSIRRVCFTFPPTFWNSKSEFTKSLSVCIINVSRVKEVAKNMLWIQTFTWQHGKTNIHASCLEYANVYCVHVLNNSQEIKSRWT